MPLLDLPRQLRELGRIRMGTTEPYTTKQGQERRRPVKLATWRFTSPSERLLEVAAGVYGGELRIWEDAPGETTQWELLSDTDVINVVVPPDRSLSQAWELWSQGGCQRRCDGQRESISDSPCLCPADPAERRELAAKPKPEACKPTTRLNLMLPDLDDLGVWRLECHGYYAAVELAGVASLLELATADGQLVPARLRLEQRTVKRPGEAPRHFGVPTLEIAHRLGDFLKPALEATYGNGGQVTATARPELSATTQQSAVSAPSVGSASSPEAADDSSAVGAAPADDPPTGRTGQSGAAPTVEAPAAARTPGGDAAPSAGEQKLAALEVFEAICGDLEVSPDQGRDHLISLDGWSELKVANWQARINKFWTAGRLDEALIALTARFGTLHARAALSERQTAAGKDGAS